MESLVIFTAVDGLLRRIPDACPTIAAGAAGWADAILGAASD
jgi:hypothetical protein